ncbi:MAG: hypothetical protein JWO74_3491, partial [Solirubrobacterales bacterium]|nr:hypothetical protein [Solirubrobacterales bacterium]
MLDPRIYRAALVPVVLAMIVCAFSLADRPRPVGTTLAPDAFAGSRAAQQLDKLAGDFPARRPGSSGDDALAQRIAALFRATSPAYQVSTPSFTGETIDGERTLTTVIARQVGAPGPGLVVVAHRDAAGRGAKAELSGTAAMLELARVVADGRLHRTITFVSTSGGSGGAAGAADLVQRLQDTTDAVLVLGDLGGAQARRPFVVGWSNGAGIASLRLRRTVEAAVRTEAGTDPGGPHAWSQWARLAFPATVSEQGPLVAAGLPAVLMSVSGERAPAPGTPVSPGRLQAFGRAALRTVIALDNGPSLEGRSALPSTDLLVARKVVPAWAIRLLIGALLLPPVLVTIDGLARARRRHAPVGRWVAWQAAAAVALLAAFAFTRLLGLTGLISAAPPAPVPPGSIPFDGSAKAAVAAIVLALVLAWLVLRPVVARALGAGGSGGQPGPGPQAALLLVLCGLAVVVWIANPYAAAVLVPATHVWLALVAPELRLRRGPALLLVAVGLVPLGLVALSFMGQLDATPGAYAWWLTLLVAGGHAGPASWLASSAFGACTALALLVAWRSRRACG